MFCSIALRFDFCLPIDKCFQKPSQKKSFRPISALSPRLKSSTYDSTRVGDPVNRRGGLILGLAFFPRRSVAEISTENPDFEIASSAIDSHRICGDSRKPINMLWYNLLDTQDALVYKKIF